MDEDILIAREEDRMISDQMHPTKALIGLTFIG
jgi:hypothetical protein